MKLWSDGKTENDCVGLAKDEVIYNLFEDIRCLKEEKEEWRTMYEKLLTTNKEWRRLDVLVRQLSKKPPVCSKALMTEEKSNGDS